MPALTDFVIRPPTQQEMSRTAYLFRNTLFHPQSQVLVALKTRPVERLVAAVAWWRLDSFIQFRLVCQPGVSLAKIFTLLVQEVMEWARASNVCRVRYADLVYEESVLSELLCANGFGPMSVHRTFEVDYEAAWFRVSRLFEKHKTQIPSNWKTESIRKHSPEAVLELMGQDRLIPQMELRHYWREYSRAGFELDVSSILFEEENPIGVMLARASQDFYFIDVRLVRVESRKFRSLGNLLLVWHIAERCKPGGAVKKLQFYGDEVQHRETLNLGIRMGGRELSPRFIFERNL